MQESFQRMDRERLKRGWETARKREGERVRSTDVDFGEYGKRDKEKGIIISTF